MLFLQALLVLAVFLLPGYAVWIAFGQSINRQITATETLFLNLLAGTAVVAWLALALAEVGWFSLPQLLILVSGGSLLLVAWAIRHGRPLANPFQGLRFRPVSLALLLMIGVTIALSPRPFQYIVGGRDHGLYVNTGVHIARTGRILIHDSGLVSAPPESRPALIKPDVSVYRSGLPGPWSEGQRLSGLTIRDLDEGIVAPHAFHLYPALIAVFYAVGGVRFALGTTMVFSLLSTLGIYFAGRRLFGQPVALLALLLLVLNVSHMWFTQYPTAEILVQFFIWGGLFAFHVMLTTYSRYAAVIAGLSFGLIHLTKLDTVFIPVILFIFLAYLWFTRRFHRSTWFFVVPYLLLLFHTAVHAFFISTIYFIDQAVRALLPDFMARALAEAAAGHPYPTDILSRLLQQNTWAIVMGLLALAALLFVVTRYRKLAGDKLMWLERHARLGKSLMAIGFGLFALYAYLIHPYFQLDALATPLNGTKQSLTLLSLYLTPLGLLLGMVGLLQVIVGSKGKKANFTWLFLFGNMLPLFIFGAVITPDHFWAIRRYVPVAIPAFILFAAYLLWQLVPQRLDNWAKGLLPLGLTAVLLITFWQDTRPVTGIVEYEGMIEQVSQLADSFPPNAVLLFEETDAANRVTAPLWIIFDETVFTIRADAKDDPTLATAVQAWQAEARDVYWITTDGGQPATLDGLTADYALTRTIAVPMVETPTDHLPRQTGHFLANFDAYRLVDKSQVSAPEKVTTLAIGSGTHEQYVHKGLYPTKAWPGLTPRRWTGDRVVIDLPVSSHPVELLIMMGNGRPQHAPVPEVEVYVNNTYLDTVQVEGQAAVYSWPMPEDAQTGGETARLRLEVEPWIPAQTSDSVDEREPGVYLDWVKVVVRE